MRLIVSLVILSYVGAPNFGAATELAPKLDLPRMHAFVKTLVQLKEFDPARYLAEPLVATNEPIPAELISIFNQIQKSVFGRGDFLTLKTCASCLLWSDVAGRTVYLQLSQFNAIMTDQTLAPVRSLLMLMFAHEVAHTVQDISALGSHISLNGFEVEGEEEQAKNPERAAGYARAHAEVDTYALMIIHDLGAAAPLTALTLFDRMRDPADKFDVPVRIETLRTYLPLIWSN